MKNVGEVLKKNRISRHYSLEYVALELGVSATTIYRMEVGNKHLCLDLFFRYCDLLEITPSDAFSDYANNHEDKIALEIGRRVLKIFNQVFPFVFSQHIGMDMLEITKSVNKIN